MNAVASQDQTEFGLVFIPSALDDYGLTSGEFRVYCHLARRAGQGVAFPGNRSIAAKCKLALRTIPPVIRSLSLKHMILTEKKPGVSTHYRLTPQSTWVGVAKGTTVGVAKGTTQCGKRDNGGVAKGTTKGTPTKVLQLREEGKVTPPRKFISELKAQLDLADQEMRKLKEDFSDGDGHWGNEVKRQEFLHLKARKQRFKEEILSQ